MRHRRPAHSGGQLQFGHEGVHLQRVLPALLRQHRRPQLHREVDLRREQVRGGEEGDGLGAVRVRQSGEDGDAPRLDRDIQASDIESLQVTVVTDQSKNTRCTRQHVYHLVI